MNDSNRAVTGPQWRAPEVFAAAERPAVLWSWLTHTGSLTALLRERCAEFNVCVLRVAEIGLDDDEAAWIGAARAVVREVFLRCGETPWIYARTLAVDDDPAARLRSLGEMPLGAWAFAQSGTGRDGLEIACVHAPDALYQRVAAAEAAAKPSALWCRRSVLNAGGESLYICECFFEDGTPWR